MELKVCKIIHTGNNLYAKRNSSEYPFFIYSILFFGFRFSLLFSKNAKEFPFTLEVI